MRRSRAITLTLLSAAMLTSACGQKPMATAHAPDRTWYDANHNPVPEIWEEKDGKRVPSPIPHDRYGRPWVQDENGNWGPLPPPGGQAHASSSSHTTTHHTSIIPWLWGGSGYRSYGGPPQASRPPAAGSRPATGGGSGSAGAGVSRGGFGSTGSAAAGG